MAQKYSIVHTPSVGADNLEDEIPEDVLDENGEEVLGETDVVTYFEVTHTKRGYSVTQSNEKGYTVQKSA